MKTKGPDAAAPSDTTSSMYMGELPNAIGVMTLRKPQTPAGERGSSVVRLDARSMRVPGVAPHPEFIGVSLTSLVAWVGLVVSVVARRGG